MITFHQNDLELLLPELRYGAFVSCTDHSRPCCEAASRSPCLSLSSCFRLAELTRDNLVWVERRVCVFLAGRY